MNFETLRSITDADALAVEVDRILNEQADADDLPLEAACEDGGFPSDFEVSTVRFVSCDDGALFFEVSVCFTEEVGTTCSDVTFDHPRSVDFRMEIWPELGTYETEVVEASRPEEF